MIGAVIGAVVRAVLQTLGGGLVAKGYLSGDELAQGIGALIFLVSLGWSVWQKSRTRTEPGGEFNPRAEVRRAKPVRRGGRGFVLPHVAEILCVAAVMGFLVVAACAQTWRPEYPDVTETPDLGGWLRVSEPVDRRPFLVRLIFSIRPWGEAGVDKAKLRLDREAAQLAGEYRDGDRPRGEPGAFAIGINGGAEF